MPFSPRVVEARLALKLIRPEQFPALAIDALEAGLDGPVIRRLAGLIQPTGYEVDMYVERFMTEAGLAYISTENAAFRLAQEIARDTLRKGTDPLAVTGDLYRLWFATGYAHSISQLGTLDDEVYVLGQPDEATRVLAGVRGLTRLPLGGLSARVSHLRPQPIQYRSGARAMDKTLRKFTSHKEMRAETYRYWHGRPDSEIFEAIWEMSVDAYREYYKLRGIVHDEAGSARSLARIQRTTS